jgi:poly(A) polymerase
VASREIALNVARRLRAAGHEALFAGGCVRDRLRGAAPKDYDLATSARPGEVEALFPRTVGVGAAFGVVLVVLGEDQVEVATFREDVGIADGRHPSRVRFADARADALRRDFTVNGMFEVPETGEVLDFVGGRGDLAARSGFARTGCGSSGPCGSRPSSTSGSSATPSRRSATRRRESRT